jgi:transposase InsO family protein
MREEGLICRRSRRRGLPYRKHGHPAYPNLASALVPTAMNQLWVADFTYVRFRGRFIFVAVILDAFSRRCIGWALAPHYRHSLMIVALRMALKGRRPLAGFVHHSDRGGEYFDDDYLSLLREHGATISIAARRLLRTIPSANGSCERSNRKKCTSETMLTSSTRTDPSSASSTSITTYDCTRSLAIGRLPNSRNSVLITHRYNPLQLNFLYQKRVAVPVPINGDD